jgi:hypothetical protein
MGCVAGDSSSEVPSRPAKAVADQSSSDDKKLLPASSVYIPKPAHCKEVSFFLPSHPRDVEGSSTGENAEDSDRESADSSSDESEIELSEALQEWMRNRY